MTAISQYWHDMFGPHEAVSKDFEHMLMREVMRTELVRVRALIIVALVIMLNLSIVHIVFPDVVQRVWRGVNPNLIYLILTGFVLFELVVYRTISHHLKLDRDLPVYRRYIGALIETSVPTLILSLQIESMGPVRALGFAMPLVYFIFIILSTLRLDFWLSAFTGFVAATELFMMAMHYKPLVNSDPRAGNLLSPLAQPRSSSPAVVLAGAVGSAATPRFCGQHSRRHRARPRHQSVRPARLATGGGAAAA